MSGQERTRPLQLTSELFASDRGTASDGGHPDKLTIPADRDRIFSQSKIIMRPHSAKMSDQLLETLVMLKCNPV